MTPDELDELKRKDLWGELPSEPRSAWREDVADENTQLGYWDWVERNLEMKEDEKS